MKFDLEGFANAITDYANEVKKGASGDSVAKMKKIKSCLQKIAKLPPDKQKEIINGVKVVFPASVISEAKKIININKEIIELMGDPAKRENEQAKTLQIDKAFEAFSRNKDESEVLDLLEKYGSDFATIEKIGQRYIAATEGTWVKKEQSIKIVNKYNECVAKLKENEFLEFNDQNEILNIAKKYADKKLDDESKKEAEETLNALKAEIKRGYVKIKLEAAEVLVSADPFAIEILDKKISKKRSVKKAAKKALLAGIKRGYLKFGDFVNKGNSKNSLFDKKVVKALVKKEELSKQALIAFNKKKSAIDVARDEYNQKVGEKGIKINDKIKEDEAVALVQSDGSLFRLMPDGLKKNERIKQATREAILGIIRNSGSLECLKDLNLKELEYKSENEASKNKASKNKASKNKASKEKTFKGEIVSAYKDVIKKQLLDIIDEGEKLNLDDDELNESLKEKKEYISTDFVKEICEYAEKELRGYNIIQKNEGQFERACADWEKKKTKNSKVGRKEVKKKTKEDKKKIKKLNAILSKLDEITNKFDSKKDEDLSR